MVGGDHGNAGAGMFRYALRKSEERRRGCGGGGLDAGRWGIGASTAIFSVIEKHPDGAVSVSGCATYNVRADPMTQNRMSAEEGRGSAGRKFLDYVEQNHIDGVIANDRTDCVCTER